MSGKKEQKGHGPWQKEHNHAFTIAVAAVSLGMTMGIGVNDVLAAPDQMGLQDNKTGAPSSFQQPSAEFPKVERPAAEFPKVERPAAEFPKVERSGTEFQK